MREMMNYRDYLIKQLSDPEEATVYLEVSKDEYQKDGDTVAFLLALQSIAEAQAANAELSSQVHLLSGKVHRARREYDWAIEDYNKVIDMNPDNVEAYYNRGVTYHHKGDYDRAIEDYTKTIQLKPDYTNAYYNRGLSFDNKGASDRAIDDFTRVIQLDPNDAGAYFNRGLVSRDEEDMTEAIRLLLTGSKGRLTALSQAIT